MDLGFFLNTGTGGLKTIQTTLVSNWIGPAFFIIVSAFAIKFIISRQFRELASFLGIAAVVGLLVFNASGLFGEQGTFKKIAEGFSNSMGTGGDSPGPTPPAPGR